MGTTDEKTDAWSEEAKTNFDNIPRRSRVTGSTSENVGNQQKRDIRACSSEPSIFSARTTITGGMLDHLIDDTLDQMAAKEDEAERIANDIKRLAIRIQELKALRDDLKKKSEEELEQVE